MVSKSNRDITPEERIKLMEFQEKQRRKYNNGCLPLFLIAPFIILLNLIFS